MHKSIVLSIQQSCLPAPTPIHNTSANGRGNPHTNHSWVTLVSNRNDLCNIHSYVELGNGMVRLCHSPLDEL